MQNQNTKSEATLFFSKDKVIVLGTTIDNKLTVEAHLEHLSKKASYKLYPLQRIRKFPTVYSQFNCCTTVRMFCSRKPKLKLEKIINKH